MSKKIIFFDADGTIIKNNFISEKTKECFKLLKESGNILVLSTGRAYPAVDGPLKELGIENMICSAGGTVVINNEIVYTKPMKKENQREILDYFDNHKVVYNIESNDYIYIKKGQKEKYLKLFEVPERDTVSKEVYESAVNRVQNISRRTKEIEDGMEVSMYKLHYYGAEILYDGKQCPVEYKKVKSDLGEKYKCVTLSIGKVFSGGEVCEKDISKKTGMDVVMEYFKVNEEDIYAIGDDYNDIEMLQHATTSIAMGQSPLEVKSYCNFITKTIDEDGFYYAMKHYGLI